MYLHFRLWNSLLGWESRRINLLKRNYMIIYWLHIFSSSIFLNFLPFKGNLWSFLEFLASELVTYSFLPFWSSALTLQMHLSLGNVTKKENSAMSYQSTSVMSKLGFFYFKDIIQVKNLTLFRRNSRNLETVWKSKTQLLWKYFSEKKYITFMMGFDLLPCPRKLEEDFKWRMEICSTQNTIF